LKRVLRHLREERNVSSKTIDNYFSALSSFFHYLVEEDIVRKNPIPSFMKRYLHQYKKPRNNPDEHRKLISEDEMAMLINSILDPRDKAIITLLAKTGIRRNELITLDIDDIDWGEGSITLKPTRKRSNLLVFFDDECARILKRWLKVRKDYAKKGCKALFIGEHRGRLKRNGVYTSVTKHAEKVGLHDKGSTRMKDHFTPHCCRHWLTTHLRRKGMSREFLQELRGDARREAVDFYDHIDSKELKRAYLATIPVLGII
jgi:integrase/recombinase XerD